MFTSIIKELSGTKIIECSEIYIRQPLIIDDYESSNTAFEEELRSLFDNINLNYTKCNHSCI